jgi:signal transduction histidine kinase
VFSNLLNNSAKFTEGGGQVTVTATIANERVTVRVRDTGIGIPAEVMPYLFELFTQVDHTLNRSQGGLGIGLALVRRLVELHGGTVSAKSDGWGSGAEFIIMLPLLSLAERAELDGAK